jgi:hypothetical protein
MKPAMVFGMTPADRRLLRQLIIAVLIKILVLTVLWWVFVRDERVEVDGDGVADRISAVVSSQASSQASSQGARK